MLTKVKGSVWDADNTYTPSGTGAVERTLQSKLDEIVSVKDFGADPANDAATNTTAIQAALDYLDGTNSGGTIHFPAGTYNVSSPLVYQQTSLAQINPGIHIKGDGRRTTILNYTGTTGVCLSLKGASGAAVAATGRSGLTEGLKVSGIGFTGTGVTSGNTDSGIYVQGFNHFIMEDFLVNNFPNYGVILDRLYYSLAPDATLDDRGAFANLKNGEISEIGTIALQVGGYASSTDYSIDHLHTENLHITANDGTAAKVYTQNWTDIGSLFYGDTIGLHLYSQNSDILTQNVTMIGSRFEGGQSDTMLKIDSCLSGKFINCFFAGRSGPTPASHVKIGSDASYNIGSVAFENCIHNTATNAYEVVGAGGVTSVRILNSRFNSVTNKVTNTNNKPVQLIEGNSYERVSGGSAPIALNGAAGDVLTSSLTGDAANWLAINNSAKTITIGNGTGTNDLTMKKTGLGVLTLSGGIGVGNAVANVNTPSGATANAIEIFDNTGASLGFIPVYAAQW